MDADALADFARDVIAHEAAAVAGMAGAVDDAFARAVDLILRCPGAILTSGVGKAGHVARKISATLASTGTPSHFLSATDAAHGDLGSVRRGDVVLALSASGESDEVLRLLSIVKKLDHPVVAMTADAKTSLGRHADVVLSMGRVAEACPLGLAPSCSTTAMLALGDALALTVMKARHFTADDFAAFHPAGQLGRKLMRVGEAMTFRAGVNLPLVSDALTVGQVLQEVSKITRRPGAVLLVGPDGRMTGLFSDGDLRRLVVSSPDPLSRPVAEVMTRDPKSIAADALAAEAMAVMRHHRIDELPVLGPDGRPAGLIDVQDLVVLKLYDVAAPG